MIALVTLMSLIHQVSGTPYVSGGDSPSGTDCSGLASWVANTATGRPTFGDRFHTGNEESALLARGFQYGTAPNALVIGWNGGHTAVTLPDGTPVSSGEGGGVKIGGGGAYQRQFTRHMYLPIDPQAVDGDPAPADGPVVIDAVDTELPPPPPEMAPAPEPAPFDAAGPELPPPPAPAFVDAANTELPPPPAPDEPQPTRGLRQCRRRHAGPARGRQRTHIDRPGKRPQGSRRLPKGSVGRPAPVLSSVQVADRPEDDRRHGHHRQYLNHVGHRVPHSDESNPGVCSRTAAIWS